MSFKRVYQALSNHTTGLGVDSKGVENHQVEVDHCMGFMQPALVCNLVSFISHQYQVLKVV